MFRIKKREQSLKEKKKFLISTYVFALGILYIFMLGVAEVVLIHVCWGDFHNSAPAEKLLRVNELSTARDCFSFLKIVLIVLSVEWDIVAVLEGGILINLILLFCLGYEVFGTMRIEDDGLLFRAPFRKRVKMAYSNIKYMGIDYGLLSLTKQFWIYFGSEPLPMKYRHRINKMKMNEKIMRIQYNQDVFDALVAQMPHDLSKRLGKCYSTIRLYKVDEEFDE